MMTGQLLLFGEQSETNKIGAHGVLTDANPTEDTGNPENGGNFLSLLLGAEQEACQKGKWLSESKNLPEIEMTDMEMDLVVEQAEPENEPGSYGLDVERPFHAGNGEVAADTDWIPMVFTATDTTADAVPEVVQTAIDANPVPTGFVEGSTAAADHSAASSTEKVGDEGIVRGAVDSDIPASNASAGGEPPLFENSGVKPNGEVATPVGPQQPPLAVDAVEPVVSPATKETGSTKEGRPLSVPVTVPALETAGTRPPSSPNPIKAGEPVPAELPPAAASAGVAESQNRPETADSRLLRVLRPEPQKETVSMSVPTPRAGDGESSGSTLTTRPVSSAQLQDSTPEKGEGEGEGEEVRKMVRQIENPKGVAVKNMLDLHKRSVARLNSGETELILENIDRQGVSPGPANLSEKTAVTPTGPPETEHVQKISPREVVTQIVEKAVLQVKKGRAEFRIELKPEFLGKMNMRISSENQHILVRIQAETPMVKEALERNLHQIRLEMKGAGLEVDKLEVHLFNESGREKEKHESPGFMYSEGNSPDDVKDGEDGPADRQPHEKRGEPAGKTGGVDYFA